jgi:polyhydroxybutyrate depolymerase
MNHTLTVACILLKSAWQAVCRPCLDQLRRLPPLRYGSPRSALAALLLASLTALHAAGKPDAKLSSGEYFIRQSWSQEQDFPRPYHVNVPANPDNRKLPVLIFLHGNGGNAKGAMNGFLKQRPTIAARYVTVFPDGYRESWNISAERSTADDRKFIEAIVEKLAACDNVERDNFTVMGNSNGAALANQLAIESRLPNIRNYVTAVSPLNVLQHDGRNFKAKGDDNGYEAVATPRKGVRIMNVSGTEDRLIPYHGGPSPAIPAKNGRLGFVAAEDSIFLWAKAMGYQGEKLNNPSSTVGKLEVFSYLDGAIIHYKALGEGHGAIGEIDEATLLRFLENKH